VSGHGSAGTRAGILPDADDALAAALTANRIMESRLNELEAKISLAEDLLDALNRTVYRQQQQIDQLQQDIRAMRQQLQEVAPTGAAGTGNEIPPHY
jgi:SlyX protein